jgi:hypothetical protein
VWFAARAFCFGELLNQNLMGDSMRISYVVTFYQISPVKSAVCGTVKPLEISDDTFLIDNVFEDCTHPRV